jgi:glutathione S-transferase
MPVKLHRCSVMWAKMSGHPCWKVQKALDEAGIEYEVVKYSPIRRSQRADYATRNGGSTALPGIELEDGTVIREESDDLVARIEAGRLTV